MNENDNTSLLKKAKRCWNDVTSQISRKVRLPKQLVVFFIVICCVVLYAVFNQEVLTVSDELADLQMQVDIKKVFKSYQLVISHNTLVEVPKKEDSISFSVEQRSMNVGNNAAGQKQFGKGNSDSHNQSKGNRITDEELDSASYQGRVTIQGTLSQIIPQMIDDPSLPPNVYSSYQLRYPPFVLPPPFTLETKLRNTLPSISGYYQELASYKRTNCEGEDICAHPSKYVHLYTNWTDADSVSTNNRDYIVFFQEPYILGQIDILTNLVIPLSYECTSYTSRESIPSVQSNRVFNFIGNIAYLIVPQGSSFPRFIHMILPKLVQLEAFISDRTLTFLVDLSPQYPIVKDLLLRLGIEEEQILDYRDIRPHGEALASTRFVMTCNTPPVHPYLFQRAQYLLHLPHLEASHKVEKKTIIYLSRRKGAINAGRRVVNEPELERHIRRFAEEAGYRFVTFFHSDYNNLDELLELWSSAALVLGPHGGAFANIQFAPKGTYVVEFLPNGAIFNGPGFKDHLSTYLHAMALGDRYYALMSAYSKNDDMVVNIRDVLNLLKTTIGNEKTV